jgi:hypothetical protein
MATTRTQQQLSVKPLRKSKRKPGRVHSATAQVDKLNVAHESVAAIFKDGMHLMKMHSIENDGCELVLDQEAYLLSEKIGSLIAFTAREDGDMIGYGVFYVCEDPKHNNTAMATSDAIYLHPDHRSAMNGIRLIKYVNDSLRKLEIQQINYLVNTVDFSPILERFGYHQSEVVYTRDY